MVIAVLARKRTRYNNTVIQCLCNTVIQCLCNRGVWRVPQASSSSLLFLQWHHCMRVLIWLSMVFGVAHANWVGTDNPSLAEIASASALLQAEHFSRFTVFLPATALQLSHVTVWYSQSKSIRHFWSFHRWQFASLHVHPSDALEGPLFILPH